MIIIVNAGPFKGFQTDSLLGLLEYQRNKRLQCLHSDLKDESGVCGRGLRKKRWQRQRCNHCGEALNCQQTPIPDHLEQQKLDQEAWNLIRSRNCKTYVVEKFIPGYGYSPVWNHDFHGLKASKTKALKEYRSQFDDPNSKLRCIVVN